MSIGSISEGMKEVDGVKARNRSCRDASAPPVKSTRIPCFGDPFFFGPWTLGESWWITPCFFQLSKRIFGEIKRYTRMFICCTATCWKFKRFSFEVEPGRLSNLIQALATGHPFDAHGSCWNRRNRRGRLSTCSVRKVQHDFNCQTHYLHQLLWDSCSGIILHILLGLCICVHIHHMCM